MTELVQSDPRAQPTQLNFIHNWFEELERLVPVDGTVKIDVRRASQRPRIVGLNLTVPLRRVNRHHHRHIWFWYKIGSKS